MTPQRSLGPIIAAVVFGILFVAATAFGIWTFSERNTYKNEADALIEDAVVIAVQESESAKEVEFLEREKSPVRNYTGPSTYGSLSFDYPKTWSVYEESSNSGTVLDIYAHPGVVPGTDSEAPYALRVEILSDTYDRVITELNRTVESGELTTTAFRPERQQSTLGVRADGLIERDKSGSAIYLPLRDRTIRVSTQVAQNLQDFNSIILPSLNFVP